MSVIKNRYDSQYVKRAHSDYSYAFKMQVVREVESGLIGIFQANLSIQGVKI